MSTFILTCIPQTVLVLYFGYFQACLCFQKRHAFICECFYNGVICEYNTHNACFHAKKFIFPADSALGSIQVVMLVMELFTGYRGLQKIGTKRSTQFQRVRYSVTLAATSKVCYCKASRNSPFLITPSSGSCYKDAENFLFIGSLSGVDTKSARGLTITNGIMQKR